MVRAGWGGSVSQFIPAVTRNFFFLQLASALLLLLPSDFTHVVARCMPALIVLAFLLLLPSDWTHVGSRCMSAWWHQAVTRCASYAGISYLLLHVSASNPVWPHEPTANHILLQRRIIPWHRSQYLHNLITILVHAHGRII